MKRLKSLKIPGLPQQSISRQIPLLIGGTLLFSLLFAGILATTQISRISDSQAQNLGNIISKQTANAARDMLVTGDRLSLNVMLSQLTRSEPFARATIYSIDKKRIASTESASYSPQKIYTTFTAPIEYQNVIAGELVLEMDVSRFERPAFEAFWIFLGLALLLGTTGTVVAWNYAKNRQILLSRSVRQLVGLSNGQLAYGSETKDEVQQLTRQLEHLITLDKTSAPPILQEQYNPQPEPVEPHTEDTSIILAVRFSNLARLHNQLSQTILLELLEQSLPLIGRAAQQHNGQLEYSAEGNAYIRFSRDQGLESGIFEAICCARLIQKLLSPCDDETPSLQVELGISTLMPTTPGEQHPSLSDSAASQALLLASLGRGRLLLDGEYSADSMKSIHAELIETSFGSDISEVGALSEQFQLQVDRLAEQAPAN